MPHTLTPRLRVGAWTAALIAIAIGGSAACAALARFAHAPPGDTGAYSFAAGMQLPVAVVNGAIGAFPVVAGALVVFALLGFAGWRLACALRDDATIPDSAILVAQTLTAVALSFFAITFSSDPYAYVIFARAHGVFGLNPYIFFGPLGIIHDTVLQQCLAFYGDPPPSDNYGPLWTLSAGLIGRMEATSSLWLQFWTQRVTAVAGAVACTAGVLQLLRNAVPAARRYGAALFAFHPLVLWESAVGGHNDFLMLACAVWAIATVDAYPILAGALLGVAIGIKFVPVLLLPVFFARIYRTTGFGSALTSSMLALLIPIGAFVPFWNGQATIFSLVTLDARLGLSPTWLLIEPLIGHAVVNAPVAIGLHGALVDALSWGRLVQIVLSIAVLVVLAIATVRVARGAPLRELLRVVTAFVWSLPSVNSWYVVWLLPAVALGDAWASYAWWFGALAALHFAVDSGAVGSVPGAVAWASLITLVIMGLPVLIAILVRGRSAARGEQAAAG
jgi:glycosyl transferase family 87